MGGGGVRNDKRKKLKTIGIFLYIIIEIKFY